jgi:hypothetical protein
MSDFCNEFYYVVDIGFYYSPNDVEEVFSEVRQQLLGQMSQAFPLHLCLMLLGWGCTTWWGSEEYRSFGERGSRWPEKERELVAPSMSWL